MVYREMQTSYDTEWFRETFANEVAAAGVLLYLLYQGGIEDFLPKDIGGVGDGVHAQEYIEMRKKVTDKLSQIMEDNGADYGIINRYPKGQQQNPWSEESLTMKYFLLMQRERDTDFNEICFMGGKTLGDLELRYALELIQNIKREDNNSSQIFNAKKEKYGKSVAIYKAFTAIALNKIKIPGRKHGIADSVALGAPSSIYIDPKEYDVVEMEVPFSGVLAVYFMSPELSFDGPPYGIPPNPHNRDNKSGKGSEHEIICDMGNLPIKIRKMSDMDRFPTPSYAKARLRALGQGFEPTVPIQF
jgi:hypothetical protein